MERTNNKLNEIGMLWTLSGSEDRMTEEISDLWYFFAKSEEENDALTREEKNKMQAFLLLSRVGKIRIKDQTLFSEKLDIPKISNNPERSGYSHLIRVRYKYHLGDEREQLKVDTNDKLIPMASRFHPEEKEQFVKEFSPEFAIKNMFQPEQAKKNLNEKIRSRLNWYAEEIKNSSLKAFLEENILENLNLDIQDWMFVNSKSETR